MTGGAALFSVLAFLAGPVMATADVLGFAYILSDRRGIKLAFWSLFALCVAAGTFLFFLDNHTWSRLVRGEFYYPGSPIGGEYAVTGIVPWTAGLLFLVPVIRLIARRRF